MTNYNYYKAKFSVQTAARALREGVKVTRGYGYVVRIEPPVPGDCYPGGFQKHISWCKTKAIAVGRALDAIQAQMNGYHACPCGSDKQARACCGIPTLADRGIKI